MRTKFLLESLKRKRPLERHRCRWEENIKPYLNETRWESVHWIMLFRVGTDDNSREHNNKPSGSIKFFSRRTSPTAVRYCSYGITPLKHHILSPINIGNK
jgi:hypothetical protein